MTITEVISTLVESSARSNTAFARRMGISRQALYSILTNRSNISVKSLLQLCQASGYRMILMPEEDKKPNGSLEIDNF